MLLSVVAPCFNEEAVIEETHRRLVRVLDGLPGLQYEIIYIDDGSGDGTTAKLRGIQASDSRVRALILSRNFGHQVALTAGLEHARGDAVVLMDADLQDPPEMIPVMVEKWREGFEVVYGIRARRDGETKFKLGTAHAFYRLINVLSDPPIPPDTGDFRLLDRKAVRSLLAMPERDRFLRGMITWLGFRQTGIPYARESRFAGSTKFTLGRMLRFALDAVLSFSLLPLKIASWLGVVCSMAAMLGILYALGVRLLTKNWVTGWTTLFIAILFTGGVQLISLGIIGEYLGRVYSECKRRPLYILSESLGFPHPAGKERSLEGDSHSDAL